MSILSYIKKPQLLIFSIGRRGFLNWMSDKQYIDIAYQAKIGKRINWSNPQTFNEKLQWLKLYNRQPEHSKMVDKYQVRKYIAEKIGEEYLIPLLGVWDNVDDIDFDLLPEQFVLKCSHDSGSVVVCRNKKLFDKNKAVRKLKKHMKQNAFAYGREWPYKNVKPRIIAEKYMSDNFDEENLTDYKFYCFKGKPEYLYVSVGLENHETARISFMNLDWTIADFGRSDYRSLDNLPPKPLCFEKMKELAAKLSENIPFLRVDLYEIQGKIYFSELTFFPCGGMMPFDPPEADRKLGELLDISELKSNIK